MHVPQQVTAAMISGPEPEKMSLEDYLAEGYNKDLQDIRSIESILVDVAKTFAAAFSKKNNCWPYDIKAGEETSEGMMSLGTSAMIVSAIGKMSGCCTLLDGKPCQNLPDLPKLMPYIFAGGFCALLDEIEKKKEIYSSTFGLNDPLTISHIVELRRSLKNEGIATRIDAAVSTCGVTAAVGKLIENSLTDAVTTTIRSKDVPPVESSMPWCEKSAFVALKVLQQARNLDVPFEAQKFKLFFDQHVHEQLSFSAIPDSRFDPAELAFSLEGLMLCAPESVDPMLFERVFSVLSEKQGTSAYWRPNRPFLAKRTGEIMLPISVEGANSLLRSVELMDKDKIYETFAAKVAPMFRRFLQWLRARQVEFKTKDGAPCRGWSSEHINNVGVIHLWDTSQVVEFLLTFRRFLQRHIARETLVLSRVKVQEPKPELDWDGIVEKYEPAPGSDPKEQIFRMLESEFVKPWRDGKGKKNYSMLLFGPPGTGKTTVAESLAAELKRRLITITVSDFLENGALVEARAKAIFQMLEAQSSVVIFFDEIDAFLLDRNSDLFRNQDTLFQFLTPGMLTKINDLRKAERSIFIIATNYENRIDAAIKRAGRIDQQYLLLPPDMQKRNDILVELLKGPFPGAKDLDGMARVSLNLNYKEMQGAIGRLRGAGTDTDIIKKLERAERSSDHKQYLARPAGEKFPYKEFLAVARLTNEAGRIEEINKSIRDLDARRRRAWNQLMRDSDDLEKALTAQGVVTNPQVIQKAPGAGQI